MRETRDINMSLTVLKDCIRGEAMSDALKRAGGPGSKQKKPHIPLRQSALTKVLKHVFDPVGDRACKTVVIACINPSLADVGTSKNTLRYAEMLRVVLPKTDEARYDTLAPSTWRMAQVSGADTARTYEPAGRCSSRDMRPESAEVRFKKRIRPGMVVSWRPLPHVCSALGFGNDLKLAAALCPTDAMPGAVDDAVDNLGSPEEGRHAEREGDGDDGQERYLCALMTAGKSPQTYQLKLWQQTVISVGVMEDEVILEYDAGTRYYYISS